MRLQPGLVSGDCICRSPHAGVANSDSPNPLAEFEGPASHRKKEGKGKEGKKRKG